MLSPPAFADKILAVYPPPVAGVIRATLENFALTGSDARAEIKAAANNLHAALAKIGYPFSLDAALDIAAEFFGYPSWLEALKTLPGLNKIRVKLTDYGRVNGVTRKANRDLNAAFIFVFAELERVLADGVAAVVHVHRSPRLLTLDVCPIAEPRLHIEISMEHTSLTEQSRFWKRMTTTLEDVYPAAIVDMGVSANAHELNCARAYFRVNAAGMGQPLLCRGELELFAAFERMGARKFTCDGGKTHMEAPGILYSLTMSWHRWDQPFPERVEHDVAKPLAISLWRRYMQFRRAIARSVADFAAAARTMRDLNADGVQAGALTRPDEVALAVAVPASLLFERSIGAFVDDAFGLAGKQAIAAKLASAVAPLVERHLHTLEQAIVERLGAGDMAWLEKTVWAVDPGVNKKFPVLADSASMAYGYWRYCKDVVGARGRFSSIDYAQRISELDLSQALSGSPIRVEIECPCCGALAPASVWMLGTAHDAGGWQLECACGHAERSGHPAVSIGVVEKPTDVPVFTCQCPVCVKAAQKLLVANKVALADFSGRIDDAIEAFGALLLDAESPWRLGEYGILRKGAVVKCTYIERVVAAGGAAGTRYPVPAELARLRRQMFAGSYSLALERDSGYRRVLERRTLDPYREDFLRADYQILRAGFEQADLLAFRSWGARAVAFAKHCSLTLPLHIVVWRDDGARQTVDVPTSQFEGARK